MTRNFFLKSIYFALLIILLFYSVTLWAKAISNSTGPLINVSNDELKQLTKGTIISVVEVTSLEGKTKQQLNFLIKGLHTESCSVALRKLSLYEQFSKFLDFVKESNYDEKTEMLNFHLDSPILPVPFILKFKLPRVTKEGIYSFTFTEGIFKDLRGEIVVDEVNNRCLFFTTAHWEGIHTGFNDLIIEVFATTLAKLSMEKLIRISRF